MGLAIPRSRFLLSGPSAGRRVALTFDDGPHPAHTPALLDTLGHHGIPATFFVVGREAERHPELVVRAHREGHAIGHHSWTHTPPEATPTSVLREEVRRTVALLATLTGRVADRFRPPKGALTMRKAAMLWQERQRIVLWSADPRDYLMTSGAMLVDWATGHRAAAGEVVLLHDVHPHAGEAIAAIARWRDQGVEFVTLDAWLPAERAA